MAYGALVYGYAAKAKNITQMPRPDSRYISDMDEGQNDPVDWALGHHKYGQYVYVEDTELWYSDRIIFGIFLGESGDELSLENMEEAKYSAKKISEAVKFFTGWDTDISDYGYHVCTIYD